MKGVRSRLDATGRTSRPIARRTVYAHHRPTSSARPAPTSASRSSRPRARTTWSPTSACSSRPPRPSWRWRARERIMLGSNNYLGLTGDPRVIAGGARRAPPLRHRRHRLAPAERHARPAPRAGGASSPTGWAPRTRSSSRPATRRTSARSARSSARSDTVIVDSGDHASILDGVLLSRAKLRAFRHNRLDLLEKRAGAGGGRRRRHPRRRRRRLLDGGRRRAAAGDRRPRARATARA